MALIDREYLRPPFYGSRRLAAVQPARRKPPDRSPGASFCVEALEEALSKGRPEIFNTDQGSQFSSEAFTGVLRAHGVAISMDGRGRFTDNIFVERLWRSLKYEGVYLKAYHNVAEARQGIAAYFEFYNHERLHQALGSPPAKSSRKLALAACSLPTWRVDQESALMENLRHN